MTNTIDINTRQQHARHQVTGKRQTKEVKNLSTVAQRKRKKLKHEQAHQNKKRHNKLNQIAKTTQNISYAIKNKNIHFSIIKLSET